MSAALNQYIHQYGGEFEIDTVAGTVAGIKEGDRVRFSGVTLEPADTLAERIEQAIREAEQDGGGPIRGQADRRTKTSHRGSD